MKHFDEVLKYVNELSNTIDLDSTRVRAEALFYRFKRVMEAADRKKAGNDMSGLPEIRQRRSGAPTAGAEPGAGDAAAAASGRATAAGGASTRNAAQVVAAAADAIVGVGNGPNISEELRALLNRDVIKVQGHQN